MAPQQQQERLDFVLVLYRVYTGYSPLPARGNVTPREGGKSRHSNGDAYLLAGSAGQVRA